MKQALVRPTKKKALMRYQQFLKLATKTGIAILIICFTWITIDGYHRLVSQKIIRKAAPLIIPLKPQIRESVLKKIAEKQYFTVAQGEAFFLSQLGGLPEASGGGESTPSGKKENNEK